MQGYLGTFPVNTCVTTTNSAAPTLNQVALPAFINGTTLRFGEETYDLAAGRDSEMLVIFSATASSDYEPQFRYHVTFSSGAKIILEYKQFKRLKTIVIDSPGTNVGCNKT